MKKTISIFLAMLLSVGLLACGGEKKEASKTSTTGKQEVKKEDSKNSNIKKEHIDILESDKSYEEMTPGERIASSDITTDYWKYLSDEQKEKYKDRKDFIVKTRQDFLDKKKKEEEAKKLEEETKKSTPINFVDKDTLKSKVENVISDDVKGKSYTLDILTPYQQSESGLTVSVQFDNQRFSDETACKNHIAQFINNIKGIDGIKSLEIYFISNYKLTYATTVDDFNSIKSSANPIDNIQLTKYK